MLLTLDLADCHGIDRQSAARGFFVLFRMSLPVSRKVVIASSTDKWRPSDCRAMFAALMAFTAAIALRSMQST